VQLPIDYVTFNKLGTWQDSNQGSTVYTICNAIDDLGCSWRPDLPLIPNKTITVSLISQENNNTDYHRAITG
jgi:hypothetical protein